MTQGATYQPKRTSPTALTLVILLHGAAIAALALSKMELQPKVKIVDPDITFIEDQKPPPPEPAKPSPPPRAPIEITYRKPIVEIPIQRPIELPAQETVVIPRIETLPGPKIELPKATPAPVPEPKKLEPARAKANLASYVSDSDYPAAAIRSEEQGTTRFRLNVGADGRVSSCTVTGSSGSPSLDSATCRIMKNRARFSPARDSDGKTTADSVTSAIKWVLPQG